MIYAKYAYCTQFCLLEWRVCWSKYLSMINVRWAKVFTNLCCRPKLALFTCLHCAYMPCFVSLAGEKNANNKIHAVFSSTHLRDWVVHIQQNGVPLFPPAVCLFSWKPASRLLPLPAPSVLPHTPWRKKSPARQPHTSLSIRMHFLPGSTVLYR